MQWRSVEVIPFIFNELSVASVKKYVITVSYAFFFQIRRSLEKIPLIFYELYSTNRIKWTMV